MHNKCIVVGGGASGMMAALCAARSGARVMLLERNEKLGKKMYITGKGRCNVTNASDMEQYQRNIFRNPRFLYAAFARLDNAGMMALVEDLGVPLKVERGNRVFPVSDKSSDIIAALKRALELESVEVRLNTRVSELLTEDGCCVGVALDDGDKLYADAVILATGGVSYPTTGSTGIGYRLALEAGHTVLPQVPSLVSLSCKEPIPADLVGFVLKNVRLSVTHTDGKKIFDEMGEMTFDSQAIDGPLVLSASRLVSRMLNNGETLLAHIDLKPALTTETLDHRLINDLNANGNRLFHDALRLWLPAEVIPLALDRLHIEYYKRLHQINGAERKRLLNFLKNVEFTLCGTGDYNTAVVTQGGVDTKEVNPKTMESRLVPDLYFAGEVLNLDADTGGYNLQIAFSTGFAAGRAAASSSE